MKLIVGLGNPKPKHEHTRHNVGWLVVEQLKGRKKWSKSKSDLLHFAWLNWGEERVELIKPQTYMNASGQAVKRAVIKHADLELDDLYVIHDDLDLELGHFKIQLGVGPKQHNGLLSIYEALDSQNFWHVRVGVDNRQGDRSLPPDKYVLSSFTTAEEATVTQVINQVAERMRLMVK